MKHKRYWLRGVLIAVILFGILSIDSLFTGFLAFTGFWIYVKWLNEVSAWPASIVIGLLIFVAVGFIIGWLYGKIGNKNSMVSQ